ncbi:MAG: GNAT family N-acetyltransferase [Anaerolineae bacterium]|nr:GNAT family N-acetyltransferase [Anaerolineae bacterium]
MLTRRRAYDPSHDYGRVRDFLVETFALYQRPFNWLIDHWNFCRYFVVPVHTYYNTRYFGVPTRPHRSWRNELPAWEATIGLWETEAGQVVGVVNTENEEAGEAWFQIHPQYTHLYDEMLAYAETHLVDRVDGLGFLKVYVNADSELEGVVQARGYRRLDRRMGYLEYTLAAVPPMPQLPQGFTLLSVADEDDVDKRRIAKALAFGSGYAPSDWPPASAFREMQQAPDYRPDLDLVIRAPSGDYAAFCTIWLDEANAYANFEPVGTHLEYQGLGLGRLIMQEGFRRMARYGARRSFMQSSNEFYRKVGFRETPYAIYPWIKYFPV